MTRRSLLCDDLGIPNKRNSRCKGPEVGESLLEEQKTDPQRGNVELGGRRGEWVGLWWSRTGSVGLVLNSGGSQERLFSIG